MAQITGFNHKHLLLILNIIISIAYIYFSVVHHTYHIIAFTKFSETWGLDQPPIGNLGTYVFHSEKVQESLMTAHQPLTEKSWHICEYCMYKAQIQRNLGGSTIPIDFST